MEDKIIKLWVEIGASLATIVSLIFLTYQYVKEKTNFRKKIYFQDMNPRVCKGFLLNPKDLEFSYNKAKFLYNFSIFNETKKTIKINEILVYFMYKNKPFSTIMLKSHFEPNIIKPNEEFIFKLEENYPKILHKLFKNKDISYHFKNILVISYFYNNNYYNVHIPLGMTNFFTKPDFQETFLSKNEYIYVLSTNIFNQEYFNIHFYKNKIRNYQLYSGKKIGIHPKIPKKSALVGKLLDIFSVKFGIKHKDLYDNFLLSSDTIEIDLLENEIKHLRE